MLSCNSRQCDDAPRLARASAEREVPDSDGALLDFRFQFFARLLKLRRARLRLVKQMLTFRFLTLPFRQIVEEIDDADNLPIL